MKIIAKRYAVLNCEFNNATQSLHLETANWWQDLSSGLKLRKRKETQR